jgi:TRAP-type uncharacterized transport system fused permease subunit
VTQSASKIEYNENKDPSILEWMLDRKKQLWHYPLELTICLLAITLSVYHLFVAYAGSLEAHAFRSTHLSFMLVLCFLLRPLGRDKWTDPKKLVVCRRSGAGCAHHRDSGLRHVGPGQLYFPQG